MNELINGMTHGFFPAIQNTRLYFQSAPVPIDFLVDDASVTEETGGHVTIADLNHVIDQQRKSDIHVQWANFSHFTAAFYFIKINII